MEKSVRQHSSTAKEDDPCHEGHALIWTICPHATATIERMSVTSASGRQNHPGMSNRLTTPHANWSLGPDEPLCAGVEASNIAATHGSSLTFRVQNLSWRPGGTAEASECVHRFPAHPLKETSSFYPAQPFRQAAKINSTSLSFCATPRQNQLPMQHNR